MFNINISIPSDSPEIKEILEEIVEVCGELSSSPCVPLEEAETRVQDLMLRSGHKLLEVRVSQAASQQSAEPVACPQCEQWNGKHLRQISSGWDCAFVGCSAEVNYKEV
ncbi:hypothetical protein C6501_04205 [Candidatus Poribacteria bacterium]|nr:MAG: hypothetical protein C6501_04205 [Candidatus Poribacteria bacterium]